MFPAKYANLLFAFLMALLMSGLMSLVISLYNLGPGPNLLWLWLHAWAFAFVVAFPSVLVVVPLVRALVARLVRLG